MSESNLHPTDQAIQRAQDAIRSRHEPLASAVYRWQMLSLVHGHAEALANCRTASAQQIASRILMLLEALAESGLLQGFIQRIADAVATGALLPPTQAILAATVERADLDEISAAVTGWSGTELGGEILEDLTANVARLVLVGMALDDRIALEAIPRVMEAVDQRAGRPGARPTSEVPDPGEEDADPARSTPPEPTRGKPSKRRAKAGRPAATPDQRRTDALLAKRWREAHADGQTKEEFSRASRISVDELQNAIDRDRKRSRRG